MAGLVIGDLTAVAAGEIRTMAGGSLEGFKVRADLAPLGASSRLANAKKTVPKRTVRRRNIRKAYFSSDATHSRGDQHGSGAGTSSNSKAV
jgi:hypothetical protein